MSTSGSTDFSQTRDQICSDALQLLGVIGSGETASSNDITFCSNQLNKMVKAWGAKGIHVWKEEVMTVTLVANQYNYTLFPRPMYIKNCRYHYNNGLERPMTKLGRTEYDMLPTKTTSLGPSTAYNYRPELNSGVLYVWPVPQDATDTLELTYIATIEDFDASGNTPDFPQEWYETLTYQLAIRIAPAFGITLSKTNPDLLTMATIMLQEMQAWDFDEGSIKVAPKQRR